MDLEWENFLPWYGWNEDKKGSSYKSGLQFDIDRTIKRSINWQDFSSKMGSCGYEIKIGKHIAFREKEQEESIRAKIIGANYTEERIKDRILNKDRELGNIIDIKSNDKAKLSKGYEYLATKHNLKTAASTLVEIRNKGFRSMEELECGISRLSIEKNELKREFDELLWEQKRIKEVVKHIQICISKREHYEGYRKNPNDKIYMIMNRKDVEAYQKSYEEIDIFLKQFPHLRHDKRINRLTKLNDEIKILQIVLSAITTSGFIATIFSEDKYTAICGAVFSLMLLILNTYTKNYNLIELSQEHKVASDLLWKIREEYVSLLTDFEILESNEIMKKRDELQERTSKVYSNSPRTDSKSYAAAQKSLKIEEEQTFSEQEIDIMLPNSIRRCNRKINEEDK